MSISVTILLMAIVTFTPRFLGFVLSNRQVSGFWLRFLNFVPIAVFAALIVPALASNKAELDSRLLAAAVASLVIWRFKSLWLGIVVGMACFWILRSLFA